MKVSIVIPVYNAEKYLKESLDSALNQSFSDTEVIAVNDGSTDNSLRILEKYSDKIKIINQENGGVASALNTGIKNMTGEWFKWLSADDLLYPNAIEELMLEAGKLKDKKHTILYGDFDFIDDKGEIIDHMNEPNYNQLTDFEFNVILLDHLVGNGTTCLIHKSTIDEFGMFKEGIDFEDYELWLRYCLIHKCRLKLVPKAIAKYRIHKGQLTKAKLNRGIEAREELKQTILEKLSSEERSKYQIELKKYKKNKSFLDKSKFFVRYSLFKKLPSPVSNKILNLYWYGRSKK